MQATPGSFYFSGSTIYVNLPDGSDPSTHTFVGASQLYGVLLEGVNYVTVRDLTIERYQESGIAVIPFSSDKGTYFVGEYIQILNNNVWNYGTIVDDSRVMQEHTNPLQAGILVRANGQYNPHLLRGDLIQGNMVGNIDSYFGLRGSTNNGGIIAVGIDGGGTANNPVIQSNYIKT